MLLMLEFISFCNLLQSILNLSKVSDFSLRKYVHVNLEKSSTQTKMYLFPPKLSVCMGPMRSMWRSSRGSLVVRYLPFLCMLLVCFPCWQGLRTPLAFFPSLGRPRTQLNFPRVHRSLKFMWPSLSCHNSICSSMDTRLDAILALRQ